jgi:hypothetical protein
MIDGICVSAASGHALNTTPPRRLFVLILDFVYATPGIEEVSDTQNAHTVLIVFGAWSRRRRNTISKTQSNTLKNTFVSVITTMKASGWRANGWAQVRRDSDCRGKSEPIASTCKTLQLTPAPRLSKGQQIISNGTSGRVQSCNGAVAYLSMMRVALLSHWSSAQ